MIAPPWYETFFDDDYLSFYGPALGPELTAREVDFFVARLGLQPGARILDVACGHGRHSLELARRGFEVTGLDLSQGALQLAAEASEREGLSVRWVHSDVRSSHFRNEFDGGIYWGNSFGYLDNDLEDGKALRAVSRALHPGAGLLVDTLSLPGLMRNLVPGSWTRAPDGRQLLEKLEYDSSSGRLHTTITYLKPDGGRRVARYQIRVYTSEEWDRLLSLAGLSLRERLGRLDGTTHSTSSGRLIVSAVRRAPGEAGLRNELS